MNMHTLELTNGIRLIAHNLLHAPDTFKTPSEVIRAANLIEKIACPVLDSVTAAWHDEGKEEISLTEAQRDMLKLVVEKHASKLPPTTHVLSLLQQLGFE